MKRQPIAARVWGSTYRTWFPYESRHRKKAKRRSAKRERRKVGDLIREAFRS